MNKCTDTYHSCSNIVVHVVAIIFLMVPAFLQAQEKQTEEESQIWIGYLNQTRFSKRWGMWLDVHLRTKENMVQGLSQGIGRAGVTYYLTDEAKITVAYAFVNHFPGENHKNISRPEHRPWQQLQWHTKYPRLKVMQWFRLEERFRRNISNDDELGEGYAFNWRFRYNIMSQFPLSKKRFQPGTFSLALSNEVFINAGNEIVNNYFDQNRFFAGLHYHTTKHDLLQIGYMNLFQQYASGNRYRNLHTLRIFYFHNLNFFNTH